VGLSAGAGAYIHTCSFPVTLPKSYEGVRTEWRPDWPLLLLTQKLTTSAIYMQESRSSSTLPTRTCLEPSSTSIHSTSVNCKHWDDARVPWACHHSPSVPSWLLLPSIDLSTPIHDRPLPLKSRKSIYMTPHAFSFRKGKKKLCAAFLSGYRWCVQCASETLDISIYIYTHADVQFSTRWRVCTYRSAHSGTMRKFSECQWTYNIFLRV
jgi:hypothetical protein